MLEIVHKENRVFWADNLRAFATVAVIFLHVSAGPVPHPFGSVSPFFWWVANIYDSSVRFCVPIFVMLTGALLLPKDYEIGDFLKKRLFRVIFPLVFWSIIYIIFSLSVKVLHGDKIILSETTRYIYMSFKNGSSFHLWYVYMIIGIYLFMPIIGKWVRNCSEKEILYFLLIWLCTIFLNQPIISKLKPNIELAYFSGYIGYLILGYYLSIKTFKNLRKTNTLSILLIVSGIIITAVGTYFESYFKSQYNGVFYKYLSPNVLIMSIGIFVYLRNQNSDHTKLKVISNFISKYSYGIYLVHVLVLTFLLKAGIKWDFINPVFAVPITTFICLIFSGIIIYLVNKMPYGKYISG